MVSAFQDRASRQATVEAACRVALRMLSTGRGEEAALQFLANVAGRLFDSHIGITLSPGAESAAAGVSDRQDGQTPAIPEAPGALCSFPIRSAAGAEIGELRVYPRASGGLDDVSKKSLETIAQGIERIVARAERATP